MLTRSKNGDENNTEHVFDGSHYSLWRSSTMLLLADHDLVEVVTKKQDPSTEEAVLADKRQREAARRLRRLISPNVLADFADCHSASSLWQALADRYAPRSPHVITRMIAEIRGIKMTSSADAETYISALKTHSHRLKEAGAPCSEEQKICALLDGLPPFYDNFGSKLVDLSSDKYTFANAVEILRRCSALDGTNRGTRGFKPRALIGSSKQADIVCRLCRARGHRVASCPKLNEAQKALGPVSYTNDIVKGQPWYIDGGASFSMTPYRNDLTNIQPVSNESVTLADGSSLPVEGHGVALIHFNNKNIKLERVRLVPRLSHRLISEVALLDEGWSITKSNDRLTVRKPSGTLFEIKRGQGNGGLFTVANSRLALVARRVDLNHVHKQLCHASQAKIQKTIRAGPIDLDVAPGSFVSCEDCPMTKSGKVSQPKSISNHIGAIGQLVHADLMGPMRIESIGKFRWISCLTDAFSRFTHVKLLKGKTPGEVLAHIQEFHALMNTQTGSKIKAIRSDRGKEFENSFILEWLSQQGIKHELTAPHSSSQNGVAERKNRTIMESVRTIMLDHKIPRYLWGEATKHVVFVQNHWEHGHLNGDCPQRLFFGKSYDVSKFRVFGEKCHLLTEGHLDKLKAKAVEGIFVGYDNHPSIYRIYTDVRKIKTSRNVHFPVHSTERIDASEELIPVSGNSARALVAALDSDNPTHAQAMRGPDRDAWKSSMLDELANFERLDTYKVVAIPKDAKLIGSKWVHTVKTNPEDKSKRFKSRLVAQGFSQVKGLNYQETFAPVLSKVSMLALLTLAAKNDWEVHTMDVRSAYLNAKLHEDIYMRIPPDTNIGDTKWQCLKLRKSVYGLKQAGHEWNTLLDRSLRGIGWEPSKWEPCVYKRTSGTKLEYLGVYVDDILIVAPTTQRIVAIKGELASFFEMTDGGEADGLIGFKIIRDRPNKVIYLDQSHAIMAAVEEHQSDGRRKAKVPMAASTKVYQANYSEGANPESTPDAPSASADQVRRYQEMIGKLLYYANCTRPDIAYTVGLLARFSSIPSAEHFWHVDRLFAYLRGTSDYRLKIDGNADMKLVALSDADHGGDTVSQKSTSGFIIYLGKTPIKWASKKQTGVALSTMVAELVALGDLSTEIRWIKQLLIDLDIIPISGDPVTIRCDNQAVLGFIDSPKIDSKAKYEKIRHAYVRDMVTNREIIVSYIGTNKNVADVFTKPLPKERFNELRRELRLEPPHDWRSVGRSNSDA